MEKISIKINETDVEAPEGSTILEAAWLNNIDIPSLCYLKDRNCIGACRVCVVAVKGQKSLMPSCVTKIHPGMEVLTDSPDVIASRRRTLELLFSNHRMDCEYCSRYTDCEFHALCRQYGLDDRDYNPYAMAYDLDESAPHVVRDVSKCVMCRRCIAACSKQQMGLISVLGKGRNIRIAPEQPLTELGCIGCGQCIAACPTGALSERDDTQKVRNALNHGRHVVAALTPYVGAEIGEYFEEKIGTNVMGKAVAVLRKMGFARVFEAGLAGTVIEAGERIELAKRFESNERLPLLTVRCPGWVKFCEKHYPDIKEYLSEGKSTQEAFGDLCKRVYAKEAGIDPDEIFVVYISSCTAGKLDCLKEGSDVDVALTTRELAAMFKRACVSRFTARKVWRELPDETFDQFPGVTSDEAVYTAGPAVTESVYQLGKRKVKSAVVAGLEDAVRLIDELADGDNPYDLIHVLACPGGCLNGGGQPRQFGKIISFTDLYTERAKAL